MDEWISLNEFAKRYKMGHSTILELIDRKEIDCVKTGTRYRIRVGGNTVSRELYEEEKEKRIKAETKLKMLKDYINNIMNE